LRLKNYTTDDEYDVVSKPSNRSQVFEASLSDAIEAGPNSFKTFEQVSGI